MTMAMSRADVTVPVSFAADFVLKVTSAHQKSIKYKGKVQLNRSREFRWVYTTPSKREICGDGSKVRVIDHQLEQVTIYNVGSLLDMMQLLKRAKHYKGDLYVSKYHGVEYTLLINSSDQIEQIAYKDKLDNVVNIHFYKIKYGKRPFSVSKLRCHIPSSYDIIKG